MKISIFILCFLVQVNSALMAQQDSIEVKDTLKNRIGITRLQSFYDNQKEQTSITSLEYSRTLPNSSTLIGRVNYSDRRESSGFQVELESYWKHSPTYYSFAGIGVADKQVFPSFKAAYSLNRNFHNGWEGELGYRYLRSENVDVHSAVVGVGKYFGNYWLNLKGYLIDDGGNWQQSYRFTARYYLNDQLDYLTLIVATGTSPDDRNRVFQDLKFDTFLSKSIAIGYKKLFRHNYSASLTGAWTNQRISDTNDLNQYDLYFSVSKYF